MRKSP